MENNELVHLCMMKYWEKLVGMDGCNESKIRTYTRNNPHTHTCMLLEGSQIRQISIYALRIRIFNNTTLNVLPFCSSLNDVYTVYTQYDMYISLIYSTVKCHKHTYTAYIVVYLCIRVSDGLRTCAICISCYMVASVYFGPAHKTLLCMHAISVCVCVVLTSIRCESFFFFFLFFTSVEIAKRKWKISQLSIRKLIYRI